MGPLSGDPPRADVVLLDSSLVLGFLNPQDAHHDAARSAIAEITDEAVVVSIVTYAEALVGPYRSGEASIKAAERFFADIPDRIELITKPIAKAAAKLRAKHPALKLPDALIIATGDELKAVRVLTADERWRQVSKRVRVIGPDATPDGAGASG